MSLEIDENRKKILDCESNILVIGGPGSGKTTIALKKAFLYIEKYKLNRGQQVLFLSFSRNAKSRILESASNFKENDKYGNKLYVHTFHAFFLEIIQSYAYLIGVSKKISIIPPHDESALRLNRNQDNPQWIDEKKKLFYEEGKIIFDDFAKTALEILKKSSKIKKIISQTFPLIIVDEAQDTDSEQWEIVKIFNGSSQLILLGDLDQQIFDYRPDINIKRIDDIRKQVKPLEFNLENQNYRSPGTEILDFARDLISNTPKPNGYTGVKLFQYSPQVNHRNKGIRQMVGIIAKDIKEKTGRYPHNIAILSPWSKGVKIISSALREKNIPHRVQFDETATNFSSRLVACLMEPVVNIDHHLISLLEIFKDYYSTKGSEAQIKKFSGWIESINQGKKVRGKIVPFLESLLEELSTNSLYGDPAKDWIFIQKKLINSSINDIRSFALHSEFLILYNRGKIIMKELTRVWAETGTYKNARSILQNAIIQAQLSSDVISESGINVMTTYKSKGKEFDGVIMFHNEYSSPFELRDDFPALFRSRKLFLVGVTRAHHQVIILRQAGSRTPLIDNFNL